MENTLQAPTYSGYLGGFFLALSAEQRLVEKVASSVTRTPAIPGCGSVDNHEVHDDGV